jgi:hypothetical protein
MSEQDIDAKLAFTVASVWRDERISCPHRDILQSFSAGGLDSGAREFVEFHLRESQCPYCNAVVEDLERQDADARSGSMTDLRDRLLRSTAVALRGARA